ncbi:response regulator [uncultured Desulfosarcina sp.]|uniref:ATP-binding response regulator n=1 Tax=uncultured Desulfosarcina sp. TaxID=218289 RepID=UPI0029C7F955|nr:response regulator [uncultured Desulfosarcina sp.]
MDSILIADDNPENLKVLSKLLKQEGYKIRVATNGKQALESFQAEPPDLILLDIQMPKMDGYEVCRRIKAQECHQLIPVLFISAMGESFNKVLAFKAGGSDYITKPLQAEEVLARIKTHLNSYNYQRQLKEKNIELLQQFKTTFEQAAVGIAHIDIDTGQYLKVNERFADIVQYSRDELLNKTFNDITHPDFYEDDTLQVGQLINKEIPFFVKEKQYMRADGSAVWCKITVSLVENQQGQTPAYLLSIIEDISKRKKIEIEQKEYEQHVKQMQRMEAIGTLAGGIAHDFNNILSAIIGFTELALKEAPSDSFLENSLNEVYSAGKRARDLVKQILAFARQSDEKRSPIQPWVIINEALRFIRSTIPTTIEIQKELDSKSFIMGNPTQVHQLMMNLCTNAAHAMADSGGVLKVSLKDVFLDKKDLPIGMEPGDYIEIRVSDTGVGIAPELMELVFNPYFTTKEPGEGTGLGLAMAHGIIESYKGKINVDSQLGKGTTFTIHLPVDKKHADFHVSEPETCPSGTETILFVDDEVPIVKMGSKLLESLGYSVTTRMNGVEALELFKAKPDAFDLVFTDMTMPNMTGDKLAIELMKIRPEIPVVICTGYNKKISKKTASEIGIKAFIYKPLERADLSKIIRNVLDAAKG